MEKTFEEWWENESGWAEAEKLSEYQLAKAAWEASRKDMVCLSKESYERMKKDVDWLVCLESAGVDNWDGCEYAAEEMTAIYGEDW
jgi:hypothetical protein